MIDSNPNSFEVDIENYNGPLDVLLDLAKAQKVNLEEISITKLADQFNNFILILYKYNILIINVEERKIIQDQLDSVGADWIDIDELRDTLLPKLISGILRIPDAEKFLEEAGI